jgi:hypothetical protein
MVAEGKNRREAFEKEESGRPAFTPLSNALSSKAYRSPTPEGIYICDFQIDDTELDTILFNAQSYFDKSTSQGDFYSDFQQ